MSPIAAETITAPSTALGRYCTGSVRKSTITSTVAAGDEAGDLAARAHAVVDRRARAARADREALGDAGRGVRGAHREQLLGGAHVLVVLAGERACGQDLVGERDEEDAERRGQERRRRRPKRGSARRSSAARPGSAPTTATPCDCRSSAHEIAIAADDDEERRGQPGHEAAQRRAAARARPRRRATVGPLTLAELASAPPTAAAADRGRRSRGRAASRAGR